MEHAPAHRSEQPLGQEERAPDDDQEAGQEQDGDRQRRQRDEAGDFVGNFAKLRLCQVDVGADQGNRGLRGGGDLSA